MNHSPIPIPIPGLFLTLLLAACAGSGAGSGATSGGAPQFLMASQDGITRSTPGGNLKVVIRWDDTSVPLDPALSPDGKRLAYALQPPAKAIAGGGVDFGSDLYVAGVDGKDQKLLASHKQVAEFLRSPAWVSNSELLFTYRGRDAAGLPDFHIDRIDINTGKASRYIERGVDPSISKDGKRVVYVAINQKTDEEALTVAGIDLQNTRAVVTSASHLALFSSAVFSPDGTRIAFAAVDLTSPPPGGLAPPSGLGFYGAHPFLEDVWLVNVDGSGLRRLAEVAENMPSLTWNGDGTALYALGPGALWKVDVASGYAEQIGPGVPLGQIVWLSGR